MNGLARLQRISLIGVTSLLLGGGVMGLFGSAIAQGTIKLRLPDISAPGNRESGSTRSTACISPSDDLVALVPDTNFGLTEQAYPTFYFYLPPTDAEHVKFVMLNDATNALVHESQFRIQGNSGIASITLPENGLQQPLAIDQTYVWYLAVVCDKADPSADIVVEGYVQRVAPLAAAAGMAPTDLPAIYASEGLWYDALAASAQLKVSNLSTTEWNTLLDAVGLNELIPLPLLSNEFTPMASEQTATRTNQ